MPATPPDSDPPLFFQRPSPKEKWLRQPHPNLLTGISRRCVGEVWMAMDGQPKVGSELGVFGMEKRDACCVPLISRMPPQLLTFP